MLRQPLHRPSTPPFPTTKHINSPSFISHIYVCVYVAPPYEADRWQCEGDGYNDVSYVLCTHFVYISGVNIYIWVWERERAFDKHLANGAVHDFWDGRSLCCSHTWYMHMDNADAEHIYIYRTNMLRRGQRIDFLLLLAHQLFCCCWNLRSQFRSAWICWRDLIWFQHFVARRRIVSWERVTCASTIYFNISCRVWNVFCYWNRACS